MALYQGIERKYFNSTVKLPFAERKALIVRLFNILMKKSPKNLDLCEKNDYYFTWKNT